MNERIKELALQAKLPSYVLEYGTELCLAPHLEKFAQLIVQECAALNKTQSYELMGVLVDTEDGDGFDAVCLTTVQRVHEYLATNILEKHFGVEE